MENNELFNPFPGLRPFKTEESNLFFGREKETREILARLSLNRFVSIIGTSGCGKSSLIFSGLIPSLSSKVTGNLAGWRVIQMKPGNDPFGNLAAAFGVTSISGDRNIKEKIIDLLADENITLDSLVPLLGFKGDEDLLLVIDQFEELFRYRRGKNNGSLVKEWGRFIQMLVDAVNNKAGKINVVIGMRSEYIGECAHFKGLTELINNSSFLVPHMTADNYREVIEGPVRFAGAEIDKGLVQRLIDEIGDRTDQLPVLQHVLMRTWDQWKKTGNPGKPISAVDYDSAGKMREAMSKHADEAFIELDERGKEICEVLFKTITEKGNDNSGLRHPTPVGIISDIAKCSPEDLYRVIETFRAPGRSFLLPPRGVELNPNTIIDISHESLIRIWDRLAEWVDEETSSVKMYQKLSEASELFQQGKTTLLRNPELQLSLNWRSENMPTLKWAERINPAFERAMVYLRTSEKEYQTEEENKARFQRWQVRRSRIAAMVLGSAAVVSIAFMLFAFIKQVETEKSRREADGRRLLALQQEELATRRAEALAEQRNIALLDAQKARDEAIDANLRIQNEMSIAMAERRKAEEALQIANKATLNERLAGEQSLESTRLRMVAIGKTMAVKSLQVAGQGDLQALLAYQAYSFNLKNGGEPNDADIYMGLYNVAKVMGGRGYSTFDGHTGQVKSVSFIPDEQAFITSGSDGKIYRWNLDNPSNRQEIFSNGGETGFLSVSPDGLLLACITDRSVISIIPLKGGTPYELNGHSGEVNSLAYSPEGGTLYSSGTDGEVLEWNLDSKEYSVLADLADTIFSIDISKSGRFLAGASGQGEVRIWNLDNKREPGQVPVQNGPVNTIKFRDDNVLAVGFSNGMVELWDIQGSQMITEFKSHASRVNDIKFNDKFAQMATCGVDGLVMIWDLNDIGRAPISIDDNGRYVNALAFSPDGSTLVSGGEINSSGLVARASHVDYMAQGVCGLVSRNMSEDEWSRYVGRDIEYEETCNSREFKIRVQERKGE